jgi:hypothetical protein
MKSLNTSKDPTYTSVDLSIYAIAEVFIGVFTACLPPLRKTFEDVLRKVLPEGLISSRATKSRKSYALEALSNPPSTIKKSVSDHTSDEDSDYAIMEEQRSQVQSSHEDIVKTTQVIVTVDDYASERQKNGDWA